MKTVGSRELKNRLGRYLKLAAKGETVVVTDRGKPVVRMLPADSNGSEDKTLEEVLKQMEADGHLRLGTRPFKKFKPIRLKGKPLSKIIVEDRD
jgi:prevent-host-death family protein